MARLGPFVEDAPGAPPLALAVSGGGDSLCLAWLVSRWRRNLLAFVVDHGLRTESAAEAALTMERLRAMGVPARLLTLKDLQYGPGIARRAREARYAALRAACRAQGCLDLLLGHQADDQAETACMRQAARSGPDGLAGMGWISLLPDLRLVRPLLGVSRLALRNTLRAAGLEWVDDPSNEDRRAERVRVRHLLADESLRETFWCLAMDAGAARMARDARRAEAAARSVAVLPQGWAGLGAHLPEPALLSALIRCVSGRVYPPAPAAVERLYVVARESERSGASGAGATLAGARLVRWRAAWWLTREAAAVAPAVPAVDGAVWDGRFTMRLPLAAREVLGVAGDAAESGALCVAAAGLGLPRAARQGWPAAFCATLPALWWRGARVAVPALGWVAPRGATAHGGARHRTASHAVEPGRVGPGGVWEAGLEPGAREEAGGGLASCGVRFFFTPPAPLSGGGLYGCVFSGGSHNICPWP
jgi:tRNA(Ile)-lysidine synthase